MHGTGGRKAFLMVTAMVAVVIVGGGGYLVLSKAASKGDQGSVLSRQNSFSDPTTRVQLQYHEQMEAQPLTEADKKDKIVLRLSEAAGQAPVLTTIRYESGLRIITNLSKAALIDTLMRNSERALPLRFTGYKEVSKRRFELHGHDTGEFIFTYDSPTKGEYIKQRFVIIVKDDDTAVYVAMQAKETDFETQNTKLFQPLVESLDFE